MKTYNNEYANNCKLTMVCIFLCKSLKKMKPTHDPDTFCFSIYHVMYQYTTKLINVPKKAKKNLIDYSTLVFTCQNSDSQF